jgi:hypothetical protein
MAFFLSTRTTGPSTESVASPMDSSSDYGFIKGASGDPAKQATIRSYLSLYELLATGVKSAHP